MQTQQRFSAHEYLETQEAVRTKGAHIELYGLLFSMAEDTHLKDILYDQQRRMIESYNYAINLLQGRGINMMGHTPDLRIYENPQVGLHRPHIPAPNPNATRLSDGTIAQVALSLHKAGSAIGMYRASECADRDIRMYHATSANMCQEMAWEMFQYMNYRGFYQSPQLADHTMRTMNAGVHQSQQQHHYETNFGQIHS
ncbi:spore coat protein [Paenibacillus xerothermodurans]|uniref:Spore coat protein n=1 Tax=Paenibacillus xerothermodurans TaxID=1977292 RepID=A0A2W1NJ79_PAEXE|nr:spore coat protein [Paenibacillus xerothermodurans]PZE19585.1 spore coat protein [Paenibacillus xerothermodurans]